MRMREGFFVSLDQLERDGARRFYRTVRGGYVPADVLNDARPPSMRGIVLRDEWQLPLAIVFRGNTQRLRREPGSSALRAAAPLSRHTPLLLSGETVERRGQRFLVSRSGIVVRAGSVRVFETLARPRGIPEGANWIHVRLSEQALVAYEGDTPVFATLVSTGKEGFETPTGLFQIQSKHVSTTMDGGDAAVDGEYSIEDVPWTMYFNGNFALHGAFWHDNFGRPRSHGCVNLSPADARWLFSWSTPTLPAAWHGIFADRRHPGTFVYVN
jgi:hypothetical protein